MEQTAASGGNEIPDEAFELAAQILRFLAELDENFCAEREEESGE